MMREITFELPDGGRIEVRFTDQRHVLGLVVVEMTKDGQPMQMLMSPADVEVLMAMLEAETKEVGHA